MYAGLDVGGSFLKGARVDARGTVLDRQREPIARESAGALLEQLERTFRRLDPEGSVVAVGIGLPGIVERQERVRVAPNLPILDGLDVGEELARRIGRPAFVENDANAAALAEAWIGAGQGAGSLLAVTLGTGVGGGLVLGGRVWPGRSGYAGEIGHVQVEPEGLPCNCGSRGCLETVAGAPGWSRRALALMRGRPSVLQGQKLEPKVIAEAAQAGDPVALEVVDGAAAALGVGIAAALDLLNLERVVIAGGVAKAGGVLLDRVVEQVRRRSYPQVFADCLFRTAGLGDDAGVVGAARTAMLGLSG